MHLECNAIASLPHRARHSYQAPSLSFQTAASGTGEIMGRDKPQHSSSASECVCVCMQTHLHLAGPCVCGALLPEGTFLCCVPLLCLCQLCSLLSHTSLCRVSAQPCSRYLGTVRLFCSISIMRSSPLQSLTATPNQAPLRSISPRRLQPYKAQELPICGFQFSNISKTVISINVLDFQVCI